MRTLKHYSVEISVDLAHVQIARMLLNVFSSKRRTVIALVHSCDIRLYATYLFMRAPT